MTIEQADQIFSAYEELLADATTRGARRSPSLLPTSKENLISAMRLLIARLYSQGLDDEDSLKRIFHAAMFLDSFTHDALDSVGFLGAMQHRRRELIQFYQELLNIGRNDPFFWQRVYAFAGISCETKRTTFFEHIKERLGRGTRRVTATEEA